MRNGVYVIEAGTRKGSLLLSSPVPQLLLPNVHVPHPSIPPFISLVNMDLDMLDVVDETYKCEACSEVCRSYKELVSLPSGLLPLWPWKVTDTLSSPRTVSPLPRAPT